MVASKSSDVSLICFLLSIPIATPITIPTEFQVRKLLPIFLGCCNVIMIVVALLLQLFLFRGLCHLFYLSLSLSLSILLFLSLCFYFVLIFFSEGKEVVWDPIAICLGLVAVNFNFHAEFGSLVGVSGGTGALFIFERLNELFGVNLYIL